jgi:glycerate dehydrogenase
MVNITVLDGYSVNPGDLSWDELYALGPCTLYDETPAELILEHAQNAEILLTCRIPLDRSIILQLPKLRYIGIFGTGYDLVDITAAHERNVIVTNVPAYSTCSVAQLTFALLLELTHHVSEQAKVVRAGGWTRSINFASSGSSLIELDGLTMGIIGFGNIGKAVAKLAQAFGMRVLVHARHHPKINDKNVLFVEKQQLFQESDVVSLHCPLTEETKALVNAEYLALMKPTAFLINTSRGKLIIEDDLADALNRGAIAGAGLDVLSEEPPNAGNPLLTAKNCLITPHIAWATKAARKRLIQGALANVQGFLSGKLQNCIKG